MNKLQSPELPDGGTPYDAQLKVALNRVLRSTKQILDYLQDGYLFNTTKVTSNYTITQNDSFILADATSATVVITLKPALECEMREVVVKKIDSTANPVVINGNGDNIDGSASKSITTQYASRVLGAKDGDWWIKSQL
jgi:hypothetical protein